MNYSSSPTTTKLHPVFRWALLSIGIIAVVFAIIGIFLPVLPTVPFLLLAMGCFARSSERFYLWLSNHTHLGPIINPYLHGKGIPRANKIKAITLIWISITFSAVFLINIIWVKILLITIAIAVTAYLLYLPTATEQDNGN